MRLAFKPYSGAVIFSLASMVGAQPPDGAGYDSCPGKWALIILAAAQFAIIIVLFIAWRSTLAARRRETKENKKLNMALAAANIGMADWEPGASFLNGNITALTGTVDKDRQDEIPLTAAIDFIHPEDKLKIEKLIQGITDGDIVSLSQELRFKSGNAWKWRNVTGNMVEEPNGKQRFVWFATDIDGRKRLEGELLHQLRLWRMVSSIATDFSAGDCDNLTGDMTEALGQMGDALGIDRAALFFRGDTGEMECLAEWLDEGVESRPGISENLNPRRHPCLLASIASQGGAFVLNSLDDLPSDWPAEREMLEGNGIKSLLMGGICHHGELWGYVLFESFAAERKWDDVCKYVIDMAAEIFGNAVLGCRADVQLKQAAERLQLAISGAKLVMFDWYVKDGRLEINSAQPKVLGYDLEAMENCVTPWLKLMHPDDLEDVRGKYRVLAAEESSAHEYEFRIMDADGEWHWISVSGTVVSRCETGAPARVVGICQDFTPRKRAEAERLKLEIVLRNAQKLESLKVIAGGVAHDFNNLLMIILGNAELAMHNLANKAQAREDLNQIVVAGQRAAELARQMLAYSGRSHLSTGFFDLGDAVDGSINLLRGAVSKKIAINRRISEHGLTVNGDQTQIQQVLMNLIINASEAIGDEPGEINIVCDARHIKFRQLENHYFSEPVESGHYAVFEISDSGGGISPENLDRIFDPFFSTKFTGRGLGLAAAQGIVRGHGGALTVESKPGRGTTFHLLLPLDEGTEDKSGVKAENAKTMRGNNRRRHLVLFADDEREVRDVANRLFSKLDCSCIVVRDGAEAVEAFRLRKNIDCVMLDLAMPVMDGIQACVAIRRLKPGTPMIITSGYTEEEVRRRMSEARLEGVWFIKKPFSAEDIHAVMNDALNDAGEDSDEAL